MRNIILKERNNRVGSDTVFVWIHCTEKCPTSLPQWCFEKISRDFSMYFHSYPVSYTPFFSPHFSWFNDAMISLINVLTLSRGQKFHLSALNYEWNLEMMNNSSQSTRPVGWVLWEEWLVLSTCPTGWVLKSESETSIFWTGWVLTVKSICQRMGCSYEADWVNIILAVI